MPFHGLWTMAMWKLVAREHRTRMALRLLAPEKGLVRECGVYEHRPQSNAMVLGSAQ